MGEKHQYEQMDQELTFLSRKILELNEQLQESDKTKTRFLSLVANELNNPMTSLLGMVPHLKIIDEAKNKTIYDLVLKETYYLGFKIKNLVMAAQIESGVVDLSLNSASVQSIAEEVIARTRFALREKQIETVCTDEIDEAIVIDSDKVALILHNLLYNAVIYGNPKSIVEIRLYKDDTHLFVSVTNQGDAPQVEQKAQLFTRFAQNTGGFHGLGIGLSIVREICEQFEGNIDYEVNGNRVTFTAALAIQAQLLGSDENVSDLYLLDTFEDAIEL